MIDGEAVLRVAPTFFQTFSTEPQVVSTSVQPRLDKLRHLADGDAERRQDHDVVGAELVGALAGIAEEADALRAQPSLTCGLWMISPVRKTLRPGKRSRVW